MASNPGQSTSSSHPSSTDDVKRQALEGRIRDLMRSVTAKKNVLAKVTYLEAEVEVMESEIKYLQTLLARLGGPLAQVGSGGAVPPPAKLLRRRKSVGDAQDRAPAGQQISGAHQHVENRGSGSAFGNIVAGAGNGNTITNISTPEPLDFAGCPYNLEQYLDTSEDDDYGPISHK